MDRKTALPLSAAILCAAHLAVAQVPKDQLMAPPPDAQKFAVVSSAGPHGSAWLWRTSDGNTNSRFSLLLRGQVWEEDEAVHLGRNGQPDRIAIRGVTPQGDAGETFAISDREARWKSPLDEGAKAYDGRSFYVAVGGPVADNAVLAERLYSTPGRKLALLPNGEARLVKLKDLSIGEGATRKTVTAFALDGLDIHPFPVWLDGNGRFFGWVQVLGVLPEAYAGDFLKLQKAQEEALAERAPALARRFGAVSPVPVAFTHVRLFDSLAARFLEDQTVVAEKGRIVAVGPAADVKLAPQARIIDGAGKTLVPGLWDAHMHVLDDVTGPQELSMGITSVRDPGATIEPTMGRAERIAQGKLLFPAVYPSLLIDGKGPLAAQVALTVSSAAEAESAVKMGKENGFRAVKFYGSMKPEWLIPGIVEAKKQGLHVHGHVPAGMRPKDAIAAGYDEITHINMVMMQAMPDEVVNQSNGMQRFEGLGRYGQRVDIRAEPIASLIQELAQKHIAVDPTLVAFESIFVPENGDLQPAYAPFTEVLPPNTVRGFLTGGFAVPKDLTRADFRASFRKMVALTEALHRAGVLIVAGTDGYGVEIIRELELYGEAGLTPAEALRAATINPARLVNVAESTGSITVGKKADLVLVDGDPSKRIGDLRHTVWVMSEGRLMNADELRSAIGFTGRPR